MFKADSERLEIAPAHFKAGVVQLFPVSDLLLSTECPVIPALTDAMKIEEQYMWQCHSAWTI